MNRKIVVLFISFLVMVAATALLLVRVRSNYSLGNPGVTVGPVPLYNEENQRVSQVSVVLPDQVPGYESKVVPVTQNEINILPPDTVYGRRLYQSPDGFRAMLNVVLMGTDRTSIHKPKYCLEGSGWQIRKSELIKIPVPRPVPYELEAMKLTLTSTVQQGGKQYERSGIYIYWFVADGQVTAHNGERMWWMGRDLLTRGVLQRWAYVAYLSDCRPGQEGALFARMKSLISATIPDFQLVHGGVSEKMASTALDTMPPLALSQKVLEASK